MMTNRCVRCGGTNLDDHARCADCAYTPQRIDGFDCYAPELASMGAGYDAGHYRVLAELESRNFWFRARNSLVLHVLRRYAPSMRRYLEIGCGTGYVLNGISQEYPRAEVMGSEIFVEGLRHAAERLRSAHLLQMDARAIPYSGCFDVVGAFDVIEHIEEDRRVLTEMHRALADDGVLVLTVPQHPWLWSAQDEHAHHVRRYTRTELVGKVRDAGFEILKVTSFVTGLLPVMMLSRMRKPDPAAVPDPFREFRIPRWLDRLLYAAMSVDVALVKLGLTLPVGGSLLLVARKA
ncbi:MAG: class I SAM-dependent methyltransferase [Luteimonas sp.]